MPYQPLLRGRPTQQQQAGDEQQARRHHMTSEHSRMPFMDNCTIDRLLLTPRCQCLSQLLSRIMYARSDRAGRDIGDGGRLLIAQTRRHQ